MLGSVKMGLIDKDAIYLGENLDIFFIALNPPEQSNNNGHYFSGRQSTFYKQLYMSGLINADLNKLYADEEVFGGNKYNYKNKKYGIIDLIPRKVETNGNAVTVHREDVDLAIDRILMHRPKIVCFLHYKVKDNFSKHLRKKLLYGNNGKLFDNLETLFYCNYFPNGNNISTERKINIYKEIRRIL